MTTDRAPSGMKVGNYVLLSRLGEGGMGVVHLARDESGKQVALKVLRPHVVGDHEARQRLAREVRSLTRVRSRRVAEIIDADPWGPVPFVATRHVPGPNLHDHVARAGPLAGEELLEFARGLAEALHAVHRVGVLHRDVKPSNVLVESGSPVLIDFGLARLADDHKVTRTGYLLGTPGYLAPEVLYGHEPTPASDVHSWAATVAFAGTGRSAFGSGPAMAVMDRVRRGEHDLTGLGHEALALVDAALDPDPARRPALAQLIGQLGGEVTRERVDAPERPLPTMALTTQSAPHAPAPNHQPFRQPPPPHPMPHHLHREQVPAPPPKLGWASRMRSWCLGLALVILVGCFAAAAPWISLTVVGLGIVVTRSWSMSATASRTRRARRGDKWFDTTLDVIAAPWHLVLTLPVSLLLLCWGAMLAACWALVLLLLDVGDVVLLATSGVILAVSVWTGPGASRLRRPLQEIAHPIANHVVAWIAALVVFSILWSGALALATLGIEWGPFQQAPWDGDSWLSRL